ncbi:MAG: SDR family oxidoreductase, partial [Caldilineaceae bacterium]|nr:SDR family oxidoreductase [Caldilineaceae bacterium]
AYCASKAGLGLLTKVLAIEWGPRGVAVNAVAPTVILTPMGEQVWGDPAVGAPMLAKIPLGRFGQPFAPAIGAALRRVVRHSQQERRPTGIGRHAIASPAADALG